MSRLRRGMSAYVLDATNPLRLTRRYVAPASAASSSSSVGRDVVSVIRLAASTVGVSAAGASDSVRLNAPNPLVRSPPSAEIPFNSLVSRPSSDSDPVASNHRPASSSNRK